MTKGSIYQEGIISVCVYAPNIRQPKHIMPILTGLKGEISNNTILGGFNTSLSATDRQMNTETWDLNHTLEPMDFRHTEYSVQ